MPDLLAALAVTVNNPDWWACKSGNLSLTIEKWRGTCQLKSFSTPASFVSSLQLVQSEYTELLAAIDALGTSISNSLERQKHDLERTHNVEMEKVQVEIENLKNEKQLLEESDATDERTRQLETERDWYKKEALRLDEVMEQGKVRQKDLTDKLCESEQQVKPMTRQVEKLIKYSRQLEKKLKDLGVDLESLVEEGINPADEMEVTRMADGKSDDWSLKF